MAIGDNMVPNGKFFAEGDDVFICEGVCGLTEAVDPQPIGACFSIKVSIQNPKISGLTFLVDQTNDVGVMPGRGGRL